MATGGPGPMTPIPSPPPADRSLNTPSSLSKNGKERAEPDRENETMESDGEPEVISLDMTMDDGAEDLKSPVKPTRTSAVTRTSKQSTLSSFSDNFRDGRSKGNARKGVGKDNKVFTGNDGIQEKILDKDYQKIEFDYFAEYDGRPVTSI